MSDIPPLDIAVLAWRQPGLPRVLEYSCSTNYSSSRVLETFYFWLPFPLPGIFFRHFVKVFLLLLDNSQWTIG